MMPYELKKDRNGLIYIDDRDVLLDKILLDNREDKDKELKSTFYRIQSLDDFIVKRPTSPLDRKERKAYMKMIESLSKMQEEIYHTEFPIGYYRERKKFDGLIIRYYHEGISLDQVMKEKDLSVLKNYYCHSEDDVENLFMLLDEYLDCLEELLKNSIYYLDILLNNIVIDHNQVRIIDFDPTRVGVAWIDNRIRKEIFNRFINLVENIIKAYHLIHDEENAKLLLSYYTVDGYDEAKRLIKELENRVR